MHKDYTVGWICALPIELAAAKAMLDVRHDPLPQMRHDNNNYTLGRIGAHNVVVAGLPYGLPGNTSAAIASTNLLSSFPSIRFGLMVGVGGGVPSTENDIRLGDIVISKPVEGSGGVIQYDFGKTVQEGRFVQTGSLNRPPDVLLNAIGNLQSDHMMEDAKLVEHLSEMGAKHPRLQKNVKYPGATQDQLFKAEYPHPDDNATCANCGSNGLINRLPRDTNTPMVHYGLIASGNQVMKDGATREKLRKELKVLCFEMEAAGLMDNFQCLVIRGICDYADSHKNYDWQPYAASTAAAYAKELLCTIPEARVSNTLKANEKLRK